jgi:hypothetical protein
VFDRWKVTVPELQAGGASFQRRVVTLHPCARNGGCRPAAPWFPTTLRLVGLCDRAGRGGRGTWAGGWCQRLPWSILGGGAGG